MKVTIILILSLLIVNPVKINGQNENKGNNRIKIKTCYVRKDGWFLLPLTIKDKPVSTNELGKLWTVTTGTGLIIGLSEIRDKNGYYLVYYDINNDGVPDKRTMLEAASEEDILITVKAPSHWADADSADYLLRVVNNTNGQRPHVFIRPGYIRSGYYKSGKSEYDIRLYDLDCNGRYTIRESINGTTFGIYDRAGEKPKWQRIMGIIEIGNDKFICPEISPDGSVIILEPYEDEIPEEGKRFTALDEEKSEIYPLQLSDKEYTLFEFWFTRCGVCIKKMPELVTWYKKFEDSVDIQGICVDYKKNYNRAHQIIDKYQIPWDQKYIDYEDPFWLVAGALAEKTKYSFPMYVLVDKKGNIKTIQEGHLDFEVIEKIIQ